MASGNSLEDRIGEIFSFDGLTRRMLRVEGALAVAQASLGLVPERVAQTIETQAEQCELGFSESIMIGVGRSHPIMPVVEGFVASLPHEIGEYVHRGISTQDVLDSAVVLQLKDAIPLFESALKRVLGIFAERAKSYRNVPMVGRSHGQGTGAITYGFKLAILLDEYLRHLRRLAAIRERLLVGQLGGGVGTLSAYGAVAREMQLAFCAALGVEAPAISWTSARDRFSEFVVIAAMITATCGKAAHEVALLQREEINEVREGASVTSELSAVPGKRNPLLCERVMTAARIQREHAGLAIDWMMSEHERDQSLWEIEWRCIPESACLLARGLGLIANIFENLEVDAAQMTANLQRRGSYINAEWMTAEAERQHGRVAGRAAVKELLRDAPIDAGGVYSEGRLLLRADCPGTGVEAARVSKSAERHVAVGDALEATDRVLRAVEELLSSGQEAAEMAPTSTGAT